GSVASRSWLARAGLLFRQAGANSANARQHPATCHMASWPGWIGSLLETTIGVRGAEGSCQDELCSQPFAVRRQPSSASIAPTAVSVRIGKIKNQHAFDGIFAMLRRRMHGSRL